MSTQSYKIARYRFPPTANTSPRHAGRPARFPRTVTVGSAGHSAANVSSRYVERASVAVIDTHFSLE